VILTAVAAMLAFVPLTLSSFWGSLAYVLIGGVGVGTILTLLFLPALYALWFGVKCKDTQVVTELVPSWQRLGEGVEPQL
jgi:Cu/Ag efflux pump CusA